MKYRILGPLEVMDNGRVLELGGGRLRMLLVLLVLEANRVVSTDRLIDALWGERPPPTAGKALQNLVSQLRRALGRRGDEGLLTRSPGYVLEVEPDDVDAHVFERLTDQGRRLRDTDPERAAERLSEALSLWRGRALADVAYESFAQDEIARLEELRLGALEDRIDAELALGRHAQLVAEVERLVTAHPLRERFRAQLMLALYRCDRQAEALDVYQDGRRRLADDLGLEPGKTLQRLERRILNQDPALDFAEPPRTPERPGQERGPRQPSSRRRRLGLLVGLAALGLALIVAAVVAAVALTSADDPPPAVVPNSLVRIDAETNEIRDVFPVAGNPTGIIAAAGKLWVITGQTHVLARVDAGSGNVAVAGDLNFPFGVANAADGIIWVATLADHTITRLVASTLEPRDRITLPAPTAGSIAVGAGSLWVAHPFVSGRSGLGGGRPDRVSRVRGGHVVKTWDVPFPALAVAYGYGAAWVTSPDSGVLNRIDAATAVAEQLDVEGVPVAVVTGFGSAWTANIANGTVARFNSATGAPQGVVRVGGEPFGIAVGAGSVWVSSDETGTVTRIDPDTNEPVKVIQIPRGFVHGIAFAHDAAWVAVGDGDPSF